jgi:hypothetical protein
MSVQDGYIYEEEEDQDEYGDDSLKGLRKQAAKAKKLEAQMWEMQRELAFARSGLPLDDPALQYFIKGYDGELEADEILDAAERAGFIEIVDDDDAEEHAPEYNPAGEAQARVMNAAAGGSAENVTEAAALSRMQDALNEGGVEGFMAVAQEYGIPTTNDE